MVTPDELLERAAHGDSLALGRLLLLHNARLHRHIERRIPANLTSTIAADDVIQEAYTDAYRHVDGLENRGAKAFYNWLATIADRKLIDMIRAAHAAKRPPPAKARRLAADRSSSFAALAQLADEKGRTPSGVASRKEAVQAVQVALAALPEAPRQALWLRYIQGKTVAETAVALGRTQRAVQQLCYRGLRLLREEMGSRSRYLGKSR